MHDVFLVIPNCQIKHQKDPELEDSLSYIKGLFIDFIQKECNDFINSFSSGFMLRMRRVLGCVGGLKV